MKYLASFLFVIIFVPYIAQMGKLQALTEMQWKSSAASSSDNTTNVSPYPLLLSMPNQEQRYQAPGGLNIFKCNFLKTIIFNLDSFLKPTNLLSNTVGCISPYTIIRYPAYLFFAIFRI